MSKKKLTKEKLPLGHIIHGDCIATMKTFEEQSVDCIFADPPYNLQLRQELYRPDQSRVQGVHDRWDQFSSLEAYDEFTRQWLQQARRVLHKDGTIWVIGSYHNIFRIGAILQDLGFWILNDVIWHKSNPMPNFRGRRFTNAHETLIWAAHSQKSRYQFNYQAMKSFNEDTQMRSDWDIPLCTGRERLKKDDGVKLHSTQKPLGLLYRVLSSSTKMGDVLLDLFAGTGTTSAAARRLKRKFVGIEQHADYVKAAQQRVKEELPLDESWLQAMPAKEKARRIPFGSLVEQQILPAGTILVDKARRVQSRVMSDGTLLCGEQRGSIHKVGAHIINAPSCNGWKFWHFMRDGQLLCLDVLRQEEIKRLDHVGQETKRA